MADIASRDSNYVPTLTGVSSTDLQTVTTVAVNPTTHRVLVDLSGISAVMQKDVFLTTNGQTTFTATQTVAYDDYLTINGAIQTPTNSAGAPVDYTVAAGVATLSAGSYPNGLPINSIVIWSYAIS